MRYSPLLPSGKLAAIFACAVLGPAVLAAPAMAQGPVEFLISRTDMRDAGGNILIELRLLNSAAMPQILALPDRIEAKADSGESLWLDRDISTPADITVPSGGFAQARYRLAADAMPQGRSLSIPAWHTQQVVLAPATVPGKGDLAAAEVATAHVPVGALPAAPPPSDRAVGNAFLNNLQAYQPIYAVYGPSTNSEARIQISFKYQIFGRSTQTANMLRDGLYFAYTQRMFWDLAAESSPFRNIDFQPELIYSTPSVTLAGGATLGGQIGVRHESNGRDGALSRSINSIYAAPTIAIPLDADYRLTVAPKVNVYIGDKSDNPDIARYRGHTGLFLEVGNDEGLRLSTSTRYNFASGKGAVSADLSYPLPRLLGGGPDFYLFGQSFYGYGENLRDYDRLATRFRIGLALVR